MKQLVVLLVMLVLAGCAGFKNSPFTDEVETDVRDWNALNVQRIRSLNLSETFKIATIADSHSNYEDLRSVIEEINLRSDIDFVIHLGDFTDRGYNYEHDTFVRLLQKLKKPSIVVIGNHDSIGKGPQMYRRIFGETDFSFDFGQTKVIVANNNRLDFLDSWSADWLMGEVAASSSYERVIVVHHVDPDSANYFTPTQVMLFDKLYSENKVNLVLNGHQHVFEMQAKQDYVSLQVPRVQDSQYNILEFQEGVLRVLYCEKKNCRSVYP